MAANLTRAIRRTAVEAQPAQIPRVRLVDVTAVDTSTSTATVSFDGGTTTIPGVPYLSHYLPSAGDVAEMLLVPGSKTASSPLLIGTTASSRVGCRLRRTTTQAMPSGTPTAISWDTEDEDTHGFIAVTATTVTIPAGKGGRYDIVCWVNYQSVEATFHANRNYVDIGVTAAATGYPASFRVKIDSVEDQAVMSLAGIPLAAGDSFVARIFQDTGSSQNLVAAWLTCYRTGA